MSALFAVGLDTGLRNTGIAAVARLDDGTYRSLGAKVVVTEPNHDRHLRVSTDDANRTGRIFDAMADVVGRIQPCCVGLEDYHVFDTPDMGAILEAAKPLALLAGQLGVIASSNGGLESLERKLAVLAGAVARFRDSPGGAKGRGKAAKTLLVNGSAIGLARIRQLPLYVFMPADRAKRFCPDAPRRAAKKANKEAVEVGVRLCVAEADAMIEARVPQRSLREHAWDATALAVLALEQYAHYHAGVTSSAPNLL